MDERIKTPEELRNILTTLTPIPMIPTQRTRVPPAATPGPTLPTIQVPVSPGPTRFPVSPPVVVRPPLTTPPAPTKPRFTLPTIPAEPVRRTIPFVPLNADFDGDEDLPTVGPTQIPFFPHNADFDGDLPPPLIEAVRTIPIPLPPFNADFDGDEGNIPVPRHILPTIPAVRPPRPTLAPLPQPTLTLPVVRGRRVELTQPIQPILPPFQTPTIPTRNIPTGTIPTLPPIQPTVLPTGNIPTRPVRPLPPIQPTPIQPTQPLPPIRTVPTRPVRPLPPIQPPRPQYVPTGRPQYVPTLPEINITLPRPTRTLPPSPPIAETPIRYIGDLPPINIDPQAQQTMFLQELRDTFDHEMDDPTTRWLELRNRNANPLDYVGGRTRRDGNYIVNAMGKTKNELVRSIQPVFGNFPGTKDEILSLYWWGMIYNNLNIIRTPLDMEQINNLSDDQLRSVVPADWPYPRDRASITFKLLTGYNPPRADATREPRYQSIIATDPTVIMRLARHVYNYFGRSEGGMYDFYSHYSPYRHVSLQEPSIMEPFVLQYRPNRVDQMAQAMGMKIPPNITTQEEKEIYYFENLGHYNRIMTRDPDRLVPVPDLENVPRNRIQGMLEMYTDQELIDGYEMLDRYRNRYTYDSRKDLIDRIIRTQSRTNNRWHFRKRNCINADRDNIFELDTREDSNEDPLISYGTMNNYRCWNRDELEGLWEEHDGIVNFNVPDWRQGDPYQTFSAVSIRQLRDLLRETRDPIFNNLIASIENGFRIMANADLRVRGFRNHYNGLDANQQRLVRQYLVWMFLTSMYMRFWKGAGHPYPAVWQEGGGGPDRCTTAQRGDNVIQQFGGRTAILEQMPDELETWVLSFPRIEYNFTEGTSAVGAETINFIIEEAQRGTFCLAEGSEHLLGTSYYLLTQILNTDLAGFNLTIHEFIPNQGDFNPQAVTRTRHVDPLHRLRILE